MINREANKGSFKLSISTIKAMRKLRFSTAETYVYLHLLAKLYNVERDIVEVNVTQISKELGISRMQVIRVKQSLESANIIEFFDKKSVDRYKVNIIVVD